MIETKFIVCPVCGRIMAVIGRLKGNPNEIKKEKADAPCTKTCLEKSLKEPDNE